MAWYVLPFLQIMANAVESRLISGLNKDVVAYFFLMCMDSSSALVAFMPFLSV
jgi:hypothetical protein